MSRAVKDTPEVLRFTAVVVELDGKTVLGLPASVASKVQGMMKLEGVINGHPFRSPVDAGLLRVNAAMLRGSHSGVGDTVELAVLGPEPRAVPPADFKAILTPDGADSWNSLTELGRHDWVRWIESAKKPETRARRVKRAAEQLGEGKRRACCVDVNNYMMGCIEEDNKLANRIY